MKISMGAVVDGGTSLKYKTGNWRVQRPVIDYDICVNCGVCEMVCPDSAVHKIEEMYVISYDYCKGCGLCAYECKTNAIRMDDEVR